MKHVARKRFGQNFLTDATVVSAIVDAINPQPGDSLVEIGPGLGALSAPLLARCGHLHVVEIDRDLVARLRRQWPTSAMTVHEGDALHFDFASLGSRLRVVGNLPYNISTPLLFHLATYVNHVQDLHVMLQKEVVERMVAQAGEGARGRLSVMLQDSFCIDWLLDVPPGSFDPAPKVDSAVARLTPRPPAERSPHSEALSRVVAAGFSQRRKMLRNTLKGLFEAAELEALGLAPTARAEELAQADWSRLAAHLAAR